METPATASLRLICRRKGWAYRGVKRVGGGWGVYYTDGSEPCVAYVSDGRCERAGGTLVALEAALEEAA